MLEANRYVGNSTDLSKGSMGILPRRPLVLATALTGLAGFLDAAAYIQLSHLYVSFMSGNSTRLGIVLSTGSLRDAVNVSVVIIAFVVGACGGTWISDNGGPTAIVLTFTAETSLLFVAFLLALTLALRPSLVLVAVAMGMQNSLHQVIAGADVGRGYISGALFSLGQSLARLRGGKGQAWRAASDLFSWVVFVLGAALGTAALTRFGLTTCLGVSLLFASFVLIALRVRVL